MVILKAIPHNSGVRCCLNMKYTRIAGAKNQRYCPIIMKKTGVFRLIFQENKNF